MSTVTKPQDGVCVRLDRLQIVARVARNRKPPREIEGFVLLRDHFVGCQTTTSTYARCRTFKSSTNHAEIYWQYDPQKAWLKPWKITIVADDKRGLSRDEIERVLIHCRSCRLLTVEIAIDFSPSTKVNRQFIRGHAVFGKSRRRANKKEQRPLLRQPKV